MVSQGFKLDGPTTLVKKNGSANPQYWEFKRPSFSFLRRNPGSKDRAWFKCRQTGEEALLKLKVA